MRILLLEDDNFIANEIILYFTKKGNEVIHFTKSDELFNYAHLDSFDLFLFDINLPLKDGIQTLQEIRDVHIQTPTIFLTSMSEIEYVKKAYKAGGSDYIRKPFHFEELELRISQLLGTLSKSIKKISQIHTFDLELLELYENETLIQLNHNEKKLLYLLISNANHPIESTRLIEYIWTDKNVNENTLRTMIKKLRSKLSIDFIQNIRGYGYKIDKA